ncbi:uncharacterized protein FA14DRAFT_28596 [Meira miltonrushii]|uniref:Calcineurin-like phosphoesterase domain-containing protein n=1 Tax=Meira miltonrushii TaxID=1280837 RepID=A0A316V534_9BASI|nr:uncharacterized protein FA14DRAFT_28596 [Meira miltonrushii]PWN31333.1 hypothetical protein FA14DRAFT_28596 [Meira miltonrushii]
MVLPLHDHHDDYTTTDHDNDTKVKVKKGFLRKSFDVLFTDGRGTIHILRWTGFLIVLWNERLAFLLTSLRCIPSDHASTSKDPISNPGVHRMMITILADPQLIDRESYEHLNDLPLGLNKVAYKVVRWAANTYVRKAFQAVVRIQGRAQSDSVIWLGDLLDGGRRAVNTNEDVLQYERHVSRFKSLFPERVPTVYVPGNHDIRIPLTHNVIFEGESLESRRRWLQSWGTWYDVERKRYTWSVGQSVKDTGAQLHHTITSRNTKGGKREHIDSLYQKREKQVFDQHQKRAPLPSFSQKSPSQRVILRPKGGPQRIVIESNDWKRTVNARFPLYLNSNSENPTHEIALVDALHLAGMSPATSSFDNKEQEDLDSAWLKQHDHLDFQQQIKDSQWYKEGKTRFPETIDFIEGIQSTSAASTSDVQEPVRILISHIPLHRPAGTPCSTQHSLTSTNSSDQAVRIDDQGWHRESFHRDSIEQGVDQYATYQNALARPVSKWLLHHSNAKLIFSGDDHDHCHVRHQYSQEDDQQGHFAEELTLKAFSMTGGVRKPGYARLLLNWDDQLQKASAIAMPCALPDQIEIWTKVYPLSLSALILFLIIDRKWIFGRGIDRWMRDKMIGFHSSSNAFPITPLRSTTGGFEARARREIRRTAMLNRPIFIERNILREVRGMILLPLIVWLWLQLF